MFGAAGAAVATQAKSQKPDPGRVVAARTSQQTTATTSQPLASNSVAVKADGASAPKAQPAGSVFQTNAVPGDDATLRATAVARGLERKQIAEAAQVAAAAEVAKRAALAHSWRLPISNPIITSGFGYRWGRLHAGEDFAVNVGTPLASMSTGTVTTAGPESGFGNLVEISYWDGTISFYAHMSAISVNVGELVEPGQIVGESGNTGHSTGPHLHLEIHPDGGEAVDPLPWLSSHDIKF